MPHKNYKRSDCYETNEKTRERKEGQVGRLCGKTMPLRNSIHCQKLGTRWWLRVRTKAIMSANSYKKVYGDKETCSNISIMSLYAEVF